MLVDVARVFSAADGEATMALFAKLEQLGPRGLIAVNLFRAQKSSARAKTYRGGRAKRQGYGRKEWSIDNLTELLRQHGETFGLAWGWAVDEKQEFHRAVLYVDLPTGQVSFHAADRGQGPNYAGAWDGSPGASPGRICRWIAELLA